MDKNTRIDQYQKNYLEQYDFEAVMVKYRRKRVMESLLSQNPKCIVEIGCGSELLYQYYLEKAAPVDRWIIVEPGHEFSEMAVASALPNLIVINDFFEDSLQRVRQHLPCEPNLILMSSVLHEVANPHELLMAAACIMGQNCVLHVNVPNARSLHRQLAQSMGLIDDVTLLSQRNMALMQGRVYDAASLRGEFAAAGLKPVTEGGYFVKPFTHAQMQAISSHLDDAVFDGLYQLGKSNPEMASEIFIEARKT